MTVWRGQEFASYVGELLLSHDIRIKIFSGDSKASYSRRAIPSYAFGQLRASGQCHFSRLSQPAWGSFLKTAEDQQLAQSIAQKQRTLSPQPRQRHFSKHYVGTGSAHRTSGMQRVRFMKRKLEIWQRISSPSQLYSKTLLPCWH